MAQNDAATLIFRFLATSGAFHVLLAPATCYAYRLVVLTGATAPSGLPWSWWVAIAAYIAIPYLLGAWMEDSRDWQPSSRRVVWPKNALKWLLALISGTDPDPVPRDDGIEKKGGYPAGPKPAKGVPPVPQGLRKLRKQS